MRIWGPGGCAALCLSIAALAAPAAAPAYKQERQGPVAEFTVKGSNSYRIGISVMAGASTISVAEKRPGGFGAGSVIYSTFGGRAAGDRAEAAFGHFGRVRVRFHPSGEVRRRSAAPCKGGPELIRFGTFVGTIEFRGEDDYTVVDVGRARGKTRTTPPRICRLSASPDEKDRRARGAKAPKETVLLVRSEARHLELSATRTSGKLAENLISAWSHESSGGVSIFRHVLLIAPDAAFSFDDQLNSATLAPPAPFSGSASFQRIDDFASRWEGPLTVSFPGRPEVALTGRDFSWSLRSQRPRSSSTIVAVPEPRRGR